MMHCASSRRLPTPAVELHRDRPTRVLIGLGSNRCHGRHGRPEGVVQAAIAALACAGLAVEAVSPIFSTAPLGPSRRRYANAALLGHWTGSSEDLLGLLKQTEHAFGRRRGRRWGPRVLDCDLLAFGSDIVRTDKLQVPHHGMHERAFVLKPVLTLWPDWRHPLLGLTVRQMAARLGKPRPKVD